MGEERDVAGRDLTCGGLAALRHSAVHVNARVLLALPTFW
jgi:hypothetical protein